MKKWPDSLAPPTSTSLRIVRSASGFGNAGLCAWVGEGDHFDSVLDAIELLDDRRARWCLQNPEAIANKTIEHVGYSCHRHAMRKPRLYFAETCLETSAQGYMGLSSRVRSDRMEYPRRSVFGARYSQALDRLPELKLDMSTR